jgi:hypothetical protein
VGECVLEKDYVREQLECEVRESLEHKLVLRREAPLIGLVAFSVALWVECGFSVVGFQRAFASFQLWFCFVGGWVVAYFF